MLCFTPSLSCFVQDDAPMLCVAPSLSYLITDNASMQGRTALDLLSEELKVFMEHEQPGLVYSWGNGANYQLGTGATGLQAGPVRLDALRKALVVQVAAAKYHSAAVTKDGQLFTWGFGRGGRLGGCLSCDAHMPV